jgi:MerR family transcriptional regulator, heat shock protein HspR
MIFPPTHFGFVAICVYRHRFLIAPPLHPCKDDLENNVDEIGESVSSDSVPRSARGVYGISVAADLSGIDPQTLRLYERRGLLTPARTDGGTRRYSEEDLDRLQQISELVAQGINIAGVAEILHLQRRNSELESDNSRLESENARLRSEEPASGRRTRKR